MGPARRALHELLAPHIDQATVDAIAAADYGQGYLAHRAALNDLLADADPPDRLEWEPAEVLSLTLGHGRDDGPPGGPSDVVDLYVGSLLIGADTPNGMPWDRLPVFLDAALGLGPAERDAARRFLVWCRVECPADWRYNVGEQPFLTFGVLLLTVAYEPAPPAEVLRGLAGGLVEELDRSVFAGEWIGRLEPALIGRGRKKPGKVWQALARRVLVAGPLAGTEVGGQLAVLGRVICREETLAVEDLYGLFT
jgi:hypothetical protein